MDVGDAGLLQLCLQSGLRSGESDHGVCGVLGEILEEGILSTSS
jgi:hypothetical protein